MPPPGQGWPPPGYPQQHPSPGYPPPGYPPPGYPPPGYPPQAQPPQPIDFKPGIIPLRPLFLGDLYNGAVAYIRANPKATLGLTAIVVIITQVVALLLQFSALSALAGSDDSSGGAVIRGSDWGQLAGNVLTGLATLVLTGMLTVVVGRAVFGASITIGEAWQRIRGRILPLLGFTLLIGVAVVAAIAVVVVIAWVAGSANAIAGVLTGLLLGLPLLAALIWLGVKLIFAPVTIVLEQQPVFAAISRSFALVRGDFWRIFGIWLLTIVITSAIAFAIALPFGIVGGIYAALNEASMSSLMLLAVLTTIGGVIGQIITTPFSAGVTVLLYTDRRIRSEAFDLVLRTGATTHADYPATTDQLWLVGR